MTPKQTIKFLRTASEEDADHIYMQAVTALHHATALGDIVVFCQVKDAAVARLTKLRPQVSDDELLEALNA